MNSNGTLDPIEDWRMSDEELAADLAPRLTKDPALTWFLSAWIALKRRVLLLGWSEIDSGEFCPLSLQYRLHC